MGIHTTGSAVNNHISLKMERKSNAKNRTTYHLWFLVYRLVLPQLHLHPLVHHLHHRIDSVFDVNRYTENPVPERSGSTSGELRRDPLHETTETGNKTKNGEFEEVQREKSQELPGWLQESSGDLVDESTSTELWENPEQGSQDTSKSSREFPTQPRAKVEPGSAKHRAFTHLPKDPDFDICLKTKITKVSCRRRAGTVVPRAITADHNPPGEENEFDVQSRGTRFGNSVVTILPV